VKELTTYLFNLKEYDRLSDRLFVCLYAIPFRS